MGITRFILKQSGHIPKLSDLLNNPEKVGVKEEQRFLYAIERILSVLGPLLTSSALTVF